jgi:hypothetical protein
LRLLQDLTHALELKRIQTLEIIGITTERNTFLNNLKPLGNSLHGLALYLFDLVGTKSIEVRVWLLHNLNHMMDFNIDCFDYGIATHPAFYERAGMREFLNETIDK